MHQGRKDKVTISVNVTIGKFYTTNDQSHGDKEIATHVEESSFTDNVIENDHGETRILDNHKGLKTAQNLNKLTESQVVVIYTYLHAKFLT